MGILENIAVKLIKGIIRGAKNASRQAEADRKTIQRKKRHEAMEEKRVLKETVKLNKELELAKPFRITSHPSTINKSLPLLKGEYERFHIIKPYEQPQVDYLVNLHELTCNCEKFKKLFSCLPHRDICRPCSHIIEVLHNSKNKIPDAPWKYPIDEFDELTVALLKEQSSAYYCVTLLQNNTVYLGFNISSPWINIITKKKKKGDSDEYYTGDYVGHGFNILEKRWANGQYPKNSKLIKEQILKLFTFEGRVVNKI